MVFSGHPSLLSIYICVCVCACLYTCYRADMCVFLCVLYVCLCVSAWWFVEVTTVTNEPISSRLFLC